MKIFKVMPLFAALIALSACPTAPNGGGGGDIGVVPQPGDNKDESGYIKPEADSPTTQEFLALFTNEFRGIDSKIISINSNNGAYTMIINVFGEEFTATLDSLKSSTEAIFRYEQRVSETDPNLKATVHLGAMVDINVVWKSGIKNDYASEEPAHGAPDAVVKAHHEKLNAKGNIDWAKREVPVAALTPDSAKLSAFTAKVNGSGFKYEKMNPQAPSTLEPFSLKSDGSFEIAYSFDSPESYSPFYMENDNTIWYASPQRGSADRVLLEEFRFGFSWDSSNFNIIAAKPNPAFLSAFVANVNAANLVDSGNTLFNLAADGSFSQGGRTENIFFIPNNSTAQYAGFSEYGLRGKKFGRIDYDHDNNGQQTERPITMPTAMQKSDTTDPASMPTLKAALAGTYRPFTVDYPSGGGTPTTNYGAPFTINADGSFTGAALAIMSSPSTITDAVLDSARSASEGRYAATVDGNTGRFIGLEIINGTLYVSPPYSSDINSIPWFSMYPVAKKN